LSGGVTSAEWNDSHRRRLTEGILSDVVETRQRPADRAVAATHQDTEIRNVAKHVQAATEQMTMVISLLYPIYLKFKKIMNYRLLETCKVVSSSRNLY